MEGSECLRWGLPAGAAVCAPPCQVLPLLRERPAEAQTAAEPLRAPGRTPPLPCLWSSLDPRTCDVELDQTDVLEV